MLEEFRSKVVGLEGQRERLCRQFEEDKAALVSRIKAQQEELEHVRMRERELCVGGSDGEVASERASHALRASQGLMRRSLDTQHPIVIPRISAKPSPFVHTKPGDAAQRTRKDDEAKPVWRPSSASVSGLSRTSRLGGD